MTASEARLRDAADDLRLRGVRALRGSNLWRPAPVVAAEVELGRLAEIVPAAAEGFADRLGELLRSLPAQGESGPPAPLGGDGGAAAAAGWPELVGRVALALQAAAGSPADFLRVVPRGPDEAPVVALGYEEERLGTECLYEAADLLRRCLRGEEPRVGQVVLALRDLFWAERPGATTSVLLRAARRRGIPVRRVPGETVVQLGLGSALRRIDAAMTDGTSVIATDLTSDKHRTKELLRRIGVMVPDGDVVETLDDALELAADLRYPVLLKPLDANDGRGISGRLDGAEAVRAAWPVAVAEHPRVVVERYVSGRDHRVVVVDGRVVAVAERVPAHVVGDGRRTVRELAEEVNRDPRRDPHNPDATLVRVPLDGLTEQHLAGQGLAMDSVPEAGRTVTLRSTANISTGGTSVDRTDEIHPRNRVVCELATRVTGLDIAGIDVLTDDISVPFDENGAAIIEVNASPGVRMHTDPDVGTPRDVAGAIVDMLYPPGAPTTIPVLAVTGTNGKTTTTRLLAHLFRRTGRTVGYTTTDGVYFGETLVMEGDLTGPFAASIVLSDPAVEVAVLETARGGILRSGLGYESCDVGVVLNVSADHLGLRGIHTVEQLADVKAVVATAVRPGGTTVLNADQPLVLAMRERTRGRVLLFSARGETGNPALAEHLAAGGPAAVVEESDGRELLVLRRGGERIPLGTVEEVPLTIGGAARFQIENVLAAAAAAWSAGLAPEAIREGLLTFVPSAEATPGRLNVLRTDRGTVVVDYAHNPAAVRGVLEFARRMPAGRRIGVVTMPGDRRDEDLRELGSIAAGFDYVVVKEHDQYRRGRPAGEVARIIREGLVAGGLPMDRHEAVLPEPEAVERALELLRPGDLAVILADDTAGVLEQLRPLVRGPES